jgi:hypothetical protein
VSHQNHVCISPNPSVHSSLWKNETRKQLYKMSRSAQDEKTLGPIHQRLRTSSID